MQIQFGGGNRNQMEVIGHETIGQNIHGMLLTIILQPLQVDFPIVVSQKNIFPAIAALVDVMRHLGENGSTEARHKQTIPQLTS